MNEEIQKIIDLVQEGVITKEQGDALLSALSGEKLSQTNPHIADFSVHIDEDDEDEDEDEDNDEEEEDDDDEDDEDENEDENGEQKEQSEETVINLGSNIGKAVNDLLKTLNISKIINDNVKKATAEIKMNDLDLDFNGKTTVFEDNDGRTFIKKRCYEDDGTPYEKRTVSLKYINGGRVVKRELPVSSCIGFSDSKLPSDVQTLLQELLQEKFVGEYRKIENEVVLKIRIN